MLFVKNEPLYKKVSKKILELIHSDALINNTLPSEDTLTKMIGVSRSTIREALSELTSQGIITKKQGVGNIIMESAIKSKFRIDLKLDFSEMLEECGYKPKMVQSVSRNEKIIVDDNEVDIFVYDELLYADDQVAAIFKVNIFSKFFSELPNKYLEKSNFFEFIYNYTNEVIAHSIVNFEPAVAYEKTAKFFDIPVGEPIISWNEAFFSIKDECICNNQIYFNPKIFKPTILRSGFDPQESKSIDCEVVEDVYAE